MTIFPELNGPSKGLQQDEDGSHQPDFVGLLGRKTVQLKP